jgi:transposase
MILRGFFEPFVIETGPKHGRPPGDHRVVLDGVFWVEITGAPWRDIPKDLGKRDSVYRQFRCWSAAGVWHAMLDALNATGVASSSVQMIDSTVVRAHPHAAGSKRGLIRRV